MSLGLDAATGLGWSRNSTAVTLPSVLATDPVVSSGIRLMLDETCAQASGPTRWRHGAVQAVAAVLTETWVLDGSEAAADIAQHPGDTEQAP